MSIESSRPAPVVLSVVEDAQLRALVRAAFAGDEWSLIEKCRVHDALAVCLAARPDVIVLQADLAGATEFAHAGAERALDNEPPIVAIGGSVEIEVLLRAGVSDFVAHPTTPVLLAHRVASTIRLSRAEDELIRLRRRAGDDAARESAPSPRERFQERVESALHAPRSNREHVAVLHVAFTIEGAVALDESVVARCSQVVARRLRETLRARDMVGATSGNGVSLAVLEGTELAVLLESQERPQEAYKIARRLQEQVETPIDLDGRSIDLSVSIGIGVHPDDGSTAVELCRAARGAAREAQQEPTHVIRYATSAMNASAFERLTLESNLRLALERKQLILYYQPRVDIATGRIVSFEALVRWKHPELGMISPGQFIPIAEESGLIVPIGEWVLEEACRQNRRWRDAGLPRIRMAVNLSSVQFRRPDLETTIARILEDTRLEPDGLELELTESMLLQHGDRTVDTLRAIKEMGIQLAIDDFGTGYSSLSYIKRFPVDALKIDQSFIREVTTSPEDSAITTSIILMGRSLNLTVVAEGVETRSQLEFLRVLECDEAQGYLFSRAVPAEEAVISLAKGFPSVAAA